MSRYTNEQRRRGLATRRRNAKLRRERNARLGYNPDNPTVKLAENLVVTQTVESRLKKKAKSEEIPIIRIIIGIWVLTGVFMSRCSIGEEQSGLAFLGFLPAVLLTILLLYSRQKSINSRAVELAEERKERLDETRQFYSSPEWNIIRKQIIKENSRFCSECKKNITKNIDVTVDHIKPRSKYPDLALEKSNLRVLCRSCNASKGDRDSEIFVR